MPFLALVLFLPSNLRATLVRFSRNFLIDARAISARFRKNSRFVARVLPWISAGRLGDLGAEIVP